MRKAAYLLFFTLFMVFTIQGSFNLFAENKFEGKKITDIKYEGLIQNDVLSVKSVITTKIRSGFSQNVINDDIKALYNLELFDDIKVDVVETDEGLTVTFIFVELPTIREIVIRGNKRVRDRAIKDRVLLKKGSVYREQEAYTEIQEIIALYEEKGFPNTTVTYDTKKVKEKDRKTKEKKDAIDLIFSIKESRKVIIRTISFSGISDPAEEKKIRRLMKTRQRGYLFSSGFLKEDQFELDKREILRRYGNKGFIDTEIIKIDKNVQWNAKRKRDEIDLTLYIKEGSQFTFGGVEISGNEIFTDDELYPLIEIKENAIFNKTKWETSVQSIRNLLSENGYIYSTVSVKEDKDGEKLIISYEINITENNKAHIEHIFVTGNEKTKKFVIVREIVIQEGEIFNARKIQRTRDRLYNLQYFAAVNIDVKPGTEVGLVDLIFDVEEQRTGLFTFGLSYSTAGYGISIFEEVSANNFLGRGLRLYEKVDIGFTRQAVEVGIDEPWLFKTPTSAGMTLSWARTRYGGRFGGAVYTWDDGILEGDDEVPDDVEVEDDVWDYSDANSMEYVNQNVKVAFRLGRRFARYWGINSELGFSVFWNEPGEDYKDTVPYDSGLRDQYYDNWPTLWKNYLSLTGYRDSRDLSIFATRGTYISQNVTIFGGPLGGYSDFLKLNTDMNVNVKTFWKFVLSSRLNFGFLLPLPGLPLVIDDSDYIRVDGWNEGRGWQRPSQWVSLYDRKGRSELNFSLEHRFPISERIVWGLTFFDISGLYETPADFAIDFKEFYYSFGFGVSFLIPGFPVRLYLTRRFKYYEPAGEFQFANSQVFMQDWDFIFAVAGFF